MASLLASKELTLALLAGLASVMIPQSIGIFPVVILWLCRLLLSALALNLIVCTVVHWRRLSRAVLFVHVGILVILGGGLLSHLGFVATVNVYQGGTTNTAFRWDRQEDAPLGFTLMAKRIHYDYYPTPVRVGVVVAGRAVRLCEVVTGERTECAGYRIEALALDPALPELSLAVVGPDGVRTEVKAATKVENTGKGTVFQLVAFKSPVVRRTWVDLEIIGDGAASVNGQAEVNHPFVWRGLRFFYTANGSDPLGQPYAGIQIVRDPGIVLIYLGGLLLAIGSGALLLRKFSVRGRAPASGKGSSARTAQEKGKMSASDASS